MTPERWRQVEAIVHEALSRVERERETFLEQASAGDEELRREVESLLAQRGSTSGFLEAPAVAAAVQMPADIGDSLLAGRRLGVYEIHARIGAGGMGEVYRARDTKLGRDVAIKILPSLFTSDRDRLARFEREARVLAALNHPHIGAIYGVEDADGVPALVLELVDGETLADRIARGPIPVSDTLAFARQIADALEAAHEKGIVHRDLKPANTKITPDGVVKVLDFGLARATDVAAADMTQSPTLTVGGTRDGVILGTASYMSPEQARGRPADKRADVWAFGIVLYEMLTSRPAFEGETISDVLAKVIEREPDWNALPASTPPRLRELLRRCARKDPKTRLQAIGDARVQIEELISGSADEVVTSGVSVPPIRRRARFAWIVAALALLTAVALAIPATLYLLRAAPEPLPTRFEIVTPPTSSPVSFALSADGRKLAFVADAEGVPRLWVRPLDQVTARPLAGTQGASNPFWAPDGHAIGFFADGKLKRIDLGSDGPQVLADAKGAGSGTWNREGVIVFSAGREPLLRVMDTGGTPVAVTRRTPGQGSHRWPQFLPDGRHFLFLIAYGRPDTNGVYVGTLDGGEPMRILATETAAQYAPPGVLLWVDQGVLVAQRFDFVSMVLSDERIPVARGVGEWAIHRGAFGVSTTGVLAHRAGQGELRQLSWVDRTGSVRGTIGPLDQGGLSGPQLAPDGRRAAVHRNVQGNDDVYLVDIRRNLQSRFTFDPSTDHGPLWSPDGNRLVFKSLRNGQWDLFQRAANGETHEQPLLVTSEPKEALAWSPDGSTLLYGIRYPKTGWDIWALPLAGDGKPFPFLQTPFDEVSGQFSPDGRWVAFQSNESTQEQIYVQPFPGPGGRWQVSTAGGSQPRWAPDGKELFYVADDGRLMAVPIAVGGDSHTLEWGSPVTLFPTRLASGANIGTIPQYAVASDGRFLMNMAVEEASPPPITVVLNWDAALAKK